MAVRPGDVPTLPNSQGSTPTGAGSCTANPPGGLLWPPGVWITRPGAQVGAQQTRTWRAGGTGCVCCRAGPSGARVPVMGEESPPPTTHRPRQLRPAHLQESKLTTPQPPSPPRQGAFSLEGSRAEFRLGAPTLPSLLGRVARLSYTFHWRGRLCSLVPWDGHPRALPSAQLPQLPLLLQPCPGSRV